MRQPTSLTLIVAGALGAFLIAMVGVSAHSGGLLNFAGVHQTISDDRASSARTESPKPSEKPEATPTSQPLSISTAKPTQTPETNDEDSDDMPYAMPASTPYCEDECGSGGGGD